MIINSNSSLYSALSPAQVHGKHSKSQSQSATDNSTDGTTDSLDDLLSSISQQNLDSANPLSDMDAAMKTLQSVRQNMLSQPSLAMQTQAGNLSQNVALLLQE